MGRITNPTLMRMGMNAIKKNDSYTHTQMMIRIRSNSQLSQG